MDNATLAWLIVLDLLTHQQQEMGGTLAVLTEWLMQLIRRVLNDS
jgi:hypothetical protein